MFGCATIITNNGQIPNASLLGVPNKVFRDSTESETPHQDLGSVWDLLYELSRVLKDLGRSEPESFEGKHILKL